MKIYLLANGALHPRFEGGASDEPPIRPQTGLRGWLDRKFRGVRAGFKRSKSGTASGIRRAWSWMQARMYPDEMLLARLRHAARIELYYPAGTTAEEARQAWRGYLARRQWRHLPWLLFYLLLCPLTVLLTPIPGPNLVGYWFVYRAIHHLLVLIGLHRVRQERFETSYYPLECEAAAGGGDGAGPPCDCSATTFTKGSAGATGSIASNVSSR